MRARRASRRVCLPTIVIATVAAWFSWRGWTVVAQSGPPWQPQDLCALAVARNASFPRGAEILTTWRTHPLVHVSFLVTAIVGFILVRTVGLFGFQLAFTSGEATSCR